MTYIVHNGRILEGGPLRPEIDTAASVALVDRVRARLPRRGYIPDCRLEMCLEDARRRLGYAADQRVEDEEQLVALALRLVHDLPGL